MAENPTLHHPHGVGIGAPKRIVDDLRIALKQVETLPAALFAERDVEFVEAVDQVVGTLAEFGLPGFDVTFGNFGEKAVER